MVFNTVLDKGSVNSSKQTTGVTQINSLLRVNSKISCNHSLIRGGKDDNPNDSYYRGQLLGQVRKEKKY